MTTRHTKTEHQGKARALTSRGGSEVGFALFVIMLLVAGIMVPAIARADMGERRTNIGTAPKALGLGDFDNDGSTEAAMLVPGQNYVVTMDPLTFDTTVRVTGVGFGDIGGHTPIGVADIDGDGRDDLVTQAPFGFIAYEVWWPALADGNFGSPTVLNLDSAGRVRTLTTGDFLGSAGDEVMRMFRPGAATDSMEINFLREGGATSTRRTARQFNVAAVRHFVTGNFMPGGQDEAMAFYDYGGRWSAFVYPTVEGEVGSVRSFDPRPWSLPLTKELTVGDFNGDGFDDIAALQEPVHQRTQLWVLLSDGTGGLSTPSLAWEWDGLWDADIDELFGSVDVNGDGYEDIIGLHGTDPVRWYGNADGMVTWEPPAPPSTVQFCNGLPVTVSIGDGETPTSGNDVIMGTEGDDEIFALGGDDTICTLGGNDRVFAGGGSDWIDAGPGNDLLVGGGNRDRLFGGPGSDILSGGRGHDRLRGGSGDDEVLGQGGRDRLWGNSGDDIVQGGSGNDRLRGGGGNDHLDGMAGNDNLAGGRGTNSCDGGAGSDTLGFGC